MEKIILFGAGKMGKSLYEFLQQIGESEIVACFCDNNADLWGQKIGDAEVCSYEACKEKDNKFVITSVAFAAEIEKLLQDDHKEYFANIDEWAAQQDFDRVEWNRVSCAWHHIDGMENYFDIAESTSSMNVFWNKESVIYKMFCKLDLDNVIELAVGRGRHVQMYEAKANHIVLVDILQKNIDFCKERFKGNEKIAYYCNNGYNLNELNDNEYSALFTYDAMVHFEMMDVFEYLKDIHRVLRKGGMALFHHSNNTSDYKNSFYNAASGRNYMSKDLFAYLAYRAGFEVLEQQVIDWSVKDLDCVSLVRKN